MRTARALSLLLLVLASGCGKEKLVATFTSQVVQRETCRVVGDNPETCTRDEATAVLRVTLVEMQDDRAWLHGVPNGSETDTSVLGTKDAEGGYLFVVEERQENTASGCVLVERTELALRIDESATRESIGTDPCVPLLGREVATTTTSAECDEIHDPPQPITRIVRRRWEKPFECQAD